MPATAPHPPQASPTAQSARIVEIQARISWREVDVIWKRQSGHGAKRAA